MPTPNSPANVSGLLTLSANTPTKIPMIIGEAGYLIENNDSANIFVNFTGLTTGTTLIPGASISITCAFQNAAAGTQIYVVSAAGTASNAVAYLGAT